MERKVYITCTDSEIDALVRKAFGSTEYEFRCDQECSNDSHYIFDVKMGPLDEDEQEDLDTFIATGNGAWLTRTIFKHLCNKGIMEPGEYLVNVSW